MRSSLALSMTAAMVVAVPLVTAASASAAADQASASAHGVKGQAIQAAPAVSIDQPEQAGGKAKPSKDKPNKDKPHGNKHCGYPTNRASVYLGPGSQTIDRGQRAAAVGWAGCNGEGLEGASVDLQVSGRADGVCSSVGRAGVFFCHTSQLGHNSVAFASVMGSRSNGIKIRVDR